MAFGNMDFVELLKFYKDNDNFPSQARKSFDKFSEVSKSDEDVDESKDPLIIDDNCIFDLDNMCWNSHLKDNGSVKGNRPASVDGLYFVNGRLYLIEFKGTYNYTLNFEEIMDKCIEKVDDEDLVGALENIKNRYDDEILCNLKIKPSDSLFLTLPKIYQYYCEKMGLEHNKKEFLSWLLKVPKRLYVVFLNDSYDSERNESKSYKYLRMDKKLEKRYASFKELANMENSIVTQDEFRDVFVDKFFNN